MFVVCGEALMDVYTGESTATGLTLDARIGGSPLNVARAGTARAAGRLPRPACRPMRCGERLLAVAASPRASTPRWCLRSDAPTTLSVVGVDAQGVPRYAFHGHGAADRQITPEHAARTADRQRACCSSAPMRWWWSPSAAALRALAARERDSAPDRLRPQRATQRRARPRALAGGGRRDGVARAPGQGQRRRPGLLYPGIGTPKQVARRWLEQGVRLVVVTRGSEGSERLDPPGSRRPTCAARPRWSTRWARATPSRPPC